MTFHPQRSWGLEVFDLDLHADDGHSNRCCQLRDNTRNRITWADQQRDLLQANIFTNAQVVTLR